MNYGGDIFMHSNTWTAADNFARYWGLNFTSGSHYDFSRYLAAGDVIMLDSYADGSWNHAGFVVQSDNYLTNGYYDYYVAQHSDNYLAWTSTSNNHWEENDIAKIYGFIRK